MSTETLRIAMIGLGGSSKALATVLAEKGAEVVAFDAAVRKLVGVTIVDTASDALANADVVFAQSSPMLATKTARELASQVPESAVYVDLNTGTPSFKLSLSELFSHSTFADGVLSVTGDEDEPAVTLSVSGSGAQIVVDALNELGVDATFVSAEAGQASARALLGSLLREGLSNVLIDTLWAAESMGLQDWAYDEIVREFEAGSKETVRGYLSQTSANFKSLQMHMQDVLEMLSATGYESVMLAPIQFNHGRIMHGKKIPHAND